MTTSADLERATVVGRENRFVLRARRDDGEVVRAYLPNTARLGDLLVPGTPVVLRPNDDASRRTEWTATRVWDGTWVALDAAAATGLVADHLGSGAGLPGWPGTVSVRREVTYGRHRFDVEVARSDGACAVVEVKSLSRAVDGRAPLSSTPSSRGVAHLGALTALAQAGTPTAVVFVVQRGDVVALDLDAPADPAWQAAVRDAIAGGVHLAAYACEVDVTTLRLGPALRVHGASSATVGVDAAYAATHVTLTGQDGRRTTLRPAAEGTTPGRLPDLLPPGTRQVQVLTACNPRSQLLSEEDNRRRSEELAAELSAAGLAWCRADGASPDGSWVEPGFGLLDVGLDTALTLARRFGQLAVFELTADHLAVHWTDETAPPLVQGWWPLP